MVSFLEEFGVIFLDEEQYYVDEENNIDGNFVVLYKLEENEMDIFVNEKIGNYYKDIK